MKFFRNLFIILCIPVLSYILNKYSPEIDHVIDRIITTDSGKKEQIASSDEEISGTQFIDDDFVSFVTHEKSKDNVDDVEKKEYGTIKGILSRGELVVLAKKDDNNHLFQMKTKDGKYIGKDVDFAKQIAGTLGVKLIYKMTYDGYEDVVNAIARGDGDIGIAKMSFTPERSRKVLFTAPYINSRKTLLMNRIALEKGDKPDLKGLLNAKYSIIGVTKDTSYVGFVKRLFPKATLFADPDWDGKIIKTLEQGKLIATMRDEIRVKLLLKKDPSLLVKLMPIILDCEPDSLAAIVNLKNTEFLSWVNKLIEVNQILESVDDLISRYWEYIQ